MLQATGYSFISGSVISNCGLFGPSNVFKGEGSIMYMGCQDRCHVKASVIFIFNIILFVFVYIFMYKFYETQV